MTTEATEYDALLAGAGEAKVEGDLDRTVRLLEQALEKQPGAGLAGRLGNEAILARNYVAARSAFESQSALGKGAHTWNSALGLARVSVITGDEQQFQADLARLVGPWQSAISPLNRLIIAAVRNRRPEWLGQILMDFCGRHEGPLPELIGNSISQLRDVGKAGLLQQSLAAHAPKTWPLSASAIRCYLSFASDDRSAVLTQLRELSAAGGDEHIEAQPCRTALAIVPQTIAEHAGLERTSIASRLARIASAAANPVAVLVNGRNQAGETSALLKGAKSAAILPVSSDILTNREREDEWLEALASFGPRSGVRIVDYMTEYGDVNSELSKLMSHCSDEVANMATLRVNSLLPSMMVDFANRHSPVIEIQISDGVFRQLRKRAALLSYFKTEKPQTVVIYDSTTTGILQSMAILEAAGIDADVLIASACNTLKAWNDLVSDLMADLNGTASNPEPAPQEDFTVAEDVWELAQADLVATAALTSAKLARAIKPPLLVASAVDRVYGPTVKMIKSVIEDDYSLFSLYMPPRGRLGDQADKLSMWAVESERIIEIPPLRPRAVAGSVSSATVQKWLDAADLEISEGLAAAAMGRAELSLAVAEILTALLTRSLPAQMHQANALEHIFRLHRPVAVLAQPSRIAPILLTVREAKAAGILTIEAMAVYMSKMSRYRKPASDVVLAIDTFSRELLVDHFGMAASQIDLVGSLRFEPVLRKAENLPAIPDDDDRLMIMVVTQTGSLARNKALVWNALNIVRKTQGDYRVVIKAHPGEPEHHVQAYTREIARFQMSDRAFATKDSDPYELARQSSLVVSSFSNLALEAAAFGAPVLILALEAGELPVPFNDMGIAVVARKGPEFIEFAADLLGGGPIAARLKSTQAAYFERNKLLQRSGSGAAARSAILRRVKAAASQRHSSEDRTDSPRWDLERNPGAWRFTKPGSQVRARSGKQLIFVEAAVTPLMFEAHLNEPGFEVGSATYLCANPNLKVLIDEALVSGSRTGQVAAYPAVDTENDDHFYRAATEIVAPLRRRLEGRMGEASYLPEAISERLQDQLVAPYRLSRALLALTEGGEFDEVVILGSANANAVFLVEPLLAMAGVQTVVIATGTLSMRDRDVINEAVETALAGSPLRLTAAPSSADGPNPLEFLRDRRHCMISTAADPTYRDSVAEIVSGSREARSWGIALFAGDAQARADLDKATRPQGASEEYVSSGMMLGTRRASLSAEQMELLSAAYTDMQDLASSSADHVVGSCHRYICSFGAAHIPRNASYAASVGQNLEEVLGAVPGQIVTATPGRSTEARIAFKIARQRGLPTVDIQTGTFSATKRYRRPTSDWVTAIDQTHYQIYRDYFGVDPQALSIVGSPRIDRRLRPVRAVDRSLARSTYFEQHDVAGDPIVVLLATQPIEWERTEEILRVTLDGAPQGSLTIIKPHPAETSERLQRYVQAALASTSPDRRVLVEQSATAYELLPVADVVATYFSTLALEGFALQKPVAIINPFKSAPILDFAAMAIGERIKTANDMHRFVRDASRQPAAASRHPGLKVLQDGRSAERIDELLMKLGNGVSATRH